MAVVMVISTETWHNDNKVVLWHYILNLPTFCSTYFIVIPYWNSAIVCLKQHSPAKSSARGQGTIYKAGELKVIYSVDFHFKCDGCKQIIMEMHRVSDAKSYYSKKW